MTAPDNAELMNEMSATRKVVGMCLKRIAELEKQVNYFTSMKERHWEEEKIRRREATWR